MTDDGVKSSELRTVESELTKSMVTEKFVLFMRMNMLFTANRLLTKKTDQKAVSTLLTSLQFAVALLSVHYILYEVKSKYRGASVHYRVCIYSCLLMLSFT